MKRAISLASKGRRLTAEMRRHQAHALVRNPAKKASDGLSEPIRALYEMLSVTGDKRDEEIARQLPQSLADALIDDGHRQIAKSLIASGDVGQAIRAIRKKDKTWLRAWTDGVGMSPLMMVEDAVNAPSILFFGPSRIVRDTWLVHFTNSPQAVEREGFSKGVDDPRRLGLTRKIPQDEKNQPGYVFAYLPQDVWRYAYNERGPKYGSSAVVFRADAVVVRHKTDHEEQAIAWGPEAKDVAMAWFDDDRRSRPCVMKYGSRVCFDGFPEAVDFLDSRTARQNPPKRRASGAVR
jgi:hypothetical protein